MSSGPAPVPRSKRHTIGVPTAFPRQGSLVDRLQHLISIGGPIGFIPWVPATWASLCTALLCQALRPHGEAIAVATVACFLAGIQTAGVSERLLGIGDPRNVVIDEIAGQALVFVLIPAANWWLMLAGFAAFRLFDVVKPWPVSAVERLPRGWGIMTDDLVAGLYAALALLLIRRWLV